MRYTAKTWRWQDGLALWSFRIPSSAGEDLAQCLQRCVGGIMVNLQGFAEVGSVAVSTESGGEDAFEAIGASQIRELDLEGLVARDSTAEITMWLNLLVVVEPDTENTLLNNAAQLSVEAADAGPGGGIAVDVTLSIDVDLYSPLTWGEDRNNRALAEINGPRLTRFLAFLRDHLRGKLTLLDIEGYAGLGNETGFAL